MCYSEVVVDYKQQTTVCDLHLLVIKCVSGQRQWKHVTMFVGCQFSSQFVTMTTQNRLQTWETYLMSVNTVTSFKLMIQITKYENITLSP